MTMASGTECWTLLSDKYIMASIQSVEATLAEKGNKLLAKCVIPFRSEYWTESNTSPDLGAWYVAMGCWDWLVGSFARGFIVVASHGTSKRMTLGAGDTYFWIFQKVSYAKKCVQSRSSYNGWETIQRIWLVWSLWRCKRGNTNESTTTTRKTVSRHCFVDASLASDQSTRRHQTGILIFVNRLATKYSGNENFWIGNCPSEKRDQVDKWLYYKLRVMGVEIDGSTNIPDSYQCKDGLIDATLKREWFATENRREKSMLIKQW